MENIWPFLRLYLGLLLLNACEGYPIDSSRTSGGAAEWAYLSPVLAVAFLMAAVLLVTGCVCCRQNKGFQEFTDSASSHSLSAAGGGYVNSAASTTEFTIFPPAQNTVAASHNQPGDRSSVVRFEPLPDIKPPQVHTRRPAAFNNVVNHGLSAEDWFQDPHVNFPRQQLKYVRELGCGWFGRVVEGEAQNIVPGEKSTRVVVKILHEDATTTDQMYFLHEVKPYRDLSHPNVLRLLGRCLETDPFLVLLESCPSGDLKSFLSQNIATAEALNKQGITLRMACNISEGLQHLHNNSFVHTDLAARNCLVTPDLTVKVGDYGTSIDIFKEDYYCAGDVALPIRWCAPETLHCTETTIETKEVTQAANVWSLGVVLWEICEFGKLPYTELSDDEVIVKVLGEASYRLPPPSLPSQHGQNMYLLMKQCWSPKSVRPALAQVFAMLNHLYSSWERYGQDGDNTSLKTDEDFERRWEMFKPNTIPKTDNHVPSKDSTPVVLSPAHLATEKPQLHLCTDTLNVDRNSTTPLTTSPQPSLASSSGGDFYLPTLHQRHKSPSLQNLHGSIEDLSERVEQVAWQRVDEQDETSSQPSSDEREKIVEEKTTLLEPDFDSWLRGVETTNEEDAKFVRKISEAIRDLDNALALEKTSSSSSEASSHCASQQQSPAKDITNVMTEENVVLDFRLGRADSGVSSDDREMTFQPDSLQEDSYLECAKNRGTDSGTDTEDETWRRRIERGEFSEKVKEKSKSVADLMVLTHIECSDGSDSEPPSLTWSIDRSSNGRGSFRLRHGSVNKNTPMLAYSSENDIHGAVLGDDFRSTLKRLQAEVQRTVAKHILPVSDTEEQALLPSNHNRDENFLVIDASEETQKKSKIGNVSQVPEEDNEFGVTLVDNVPQTNVIECCICSLDGKGNANNGSQCYHSFHSEFKSDGEEENICSKKVNELLQYTSSATQPISCQKMENKMLPLPYGISQISNVDTVLAVASKVLPVAMDVSSGIKSTTSPLQLEMSHVLERETASKSVPDLVDVATITRKRTSPLRSDISCVSDIETTSKSLPVLADVTSGFENKTFPLQSETFHASDIETISQGSLVLDVTSATQNRTSPLRSEISHVSDIATTSKGLPVVDVTSGTENRTSPLRSEICHASDTEASSQDLPFMDVTSGTENKNLLQSEMSSTSDIDSTSKRLPVTVDITSDIGSKVSPLQSEMSHPLAVVTRSQALSVVDVMSGTENKISPLKSEMPRDSEIETIAVYVNIAHGTENKTPPLQSDMSSTSDIQTTSKILPVDDFTLDIQNKMFPLQSEKSYMSDVKTFKSLPVTVDIMSDYENKTSPVKPLMSHPTSIETASKNALVDMNITHDTKNITLSEILPSSDTEKTLKNVPVAMDITSSTDKTISFTSLELETTCKGLPVGLGNVQSIETKTSLLKSEMPHVSSSTKNHMPPLESEICDASNIKAVDVTSNAESKVPVLQSETPLSSEVQALSKALHIVDVAEHKVSPLHSEASHAPDIEEVFKGLTVVVDTSGNKSSSVQSEISQASDIETASKGLPVVESTENKVSSIQSDMFHAPHIKITSNDLPLVDSFENQVTSLQSETYHTSKIETMSKDLPVVESTENKVSPLESEMPHASGIESIHKSLSVTETTENVPHQLHSEICCASDIEIIFNNQPLAVENSEKNVSPLQVDMYHTSDMDILLKGLPVVESIENKASPLHSDISYASNIETISKGMPVVVESIENKASPLHSGISHASNIETVSKGLPVVVESTENKASPLHSDISHASNTKTASKGLPVVESTENKASPLHSAISHASNTETISEGMPAVVESTENKASPLHSDISHASNTETISKGLPVVVESTENKASPLHSDISHASNTKTVSKGLPAVESTENKASPLHSDISHASNTKTASKGLPVVESTEDKASPLHSDISHALNTETVSEGLPVVESTENKASPLHSDISHASNTASKGLPVVESTEDKASPLHSDISHASNTKTASKGLPVVESTEDKASPLHSDISHALNTETVYKGLPIVESTENKAFPLHSDISRASNIKTVSKGLPVFIESTENKASPLHSDISHASNTETVSKGLPVIESTENKTSPLHSDIPHVSNTEIVSKDLPVVMESTENKVPPSYSDTSHASNIEIQFKDLPVAVESTENKKSPLFSDIYHAVGIETESKGLPVTVSIAGNKIYSLESEISVVSDTEAASKGLPVFEDVTSDIKNKTSASMSEVPHISDIKTTEGLPFANSKSMDVEEGVSSVILGACEDYTLDYFQGLKSTLEESQQPKNLRPFENASNYDQHLVDYSIDSWEEHLSTAFQNHEERADPFDVTFKESTIFFEDEDDSVVDQPQGSIKVRASELSDIGKWNSTGFNQASNFLTVDPPAALTSRDVLYMEEKLKNPGLCIPSLNVIAATPVPSGRNSPEITENPVPGEVEKSDSENTVNKTDETSQKECDPCFNFPIILNDSQQNEDDDKQYLANIVESEHRKKEESMEKSSSCDKYYTSDVENAIESNKINGSDIFVQDATETKTSEHENKIECIQNVDEHCTPKPKENIHNELLLNDMQIIKESKASDICNKHHTSNKQDAKQTKTSEQLSTKGNHGSQEDQLIAEDSVFGRPKSFVQDLFSPELMKHSEQLEYSVALSHMEGRQGPNVFGEKEANQVSAALNSWKQSGQQNRMLMEDFLLGERLASGPFEEEEMAKQSTPDDERSSDSGFRDKGSLSESCDDACDEKYHLEDIEAELEESNKSGYERDKNVAAQDEWLDKLPAAGGKMFQDENPSVSTNSQAALSLSVDSDKDVYSDSVFTSEMEGGFGEKEADAYFSSGAASEEHDMGNITEQDDTSKSGWYLHPPVKSQELNEGSGWTTSPRTSDNNGNDNSYVSFNLEEEFVTAIRNELREKLPCSALHQQQEMEEEEEEEEEEELDEDEEERRDIVIHYNTYPAPLSPILEERESVSSITTTLSDHVSPFAHSRDILKSGSDSEPLSPVFMLDPKEEVEEMDAKRFEQEIREALENCSISSEDMSSLSDENAKKSSVLFEDLEHQSREEVVVVRNTNNNNSEDDDLLVVDTETNKATLLESPKPKSHLAFVRKAVEESVTTPSDDEELTVGINTDTYVISKSRFSDDSMIEKQKNTSSDEEVYTPDSISPENAVTASSLFSPDTENMSDFFLTPSEKSPSNNGDLLLHNLNNNADTGPMLDTVQELVANNEAAEIISELQNASICNNNSILLFNANNNDNIVPEMQFKRNITVEDNWLGSRVPENDNNVVISVEEIDDSSDKLDRLGYLRSPNLEVPREENEERDWSLPNLDATLLSTKAPMPSPEEESWKQIPSMLAFSDLNEVMARCGSNAEEEEDDDDDDDDDDPYPYQVDDNDLMSTSFSVNPDEQDCYTPDWESGDSEDDNNSSSSGEFIWKYDGLSEFPMEVIAEEDEDEEEEDGSSSCGSGTEFVPSAWNSEATPNRSALRSPDKRSDHKKNVSFKKQKYHCVYEYPRETSDSDSEGFDSPTRRPHWNSMSYQQPVVDYASFADWELMDADALPADSQDTDTDPDDNPSQQQLDFYKLSSVDYDFGCGGMVSEDGEFFISSSARPFQFSGVGSNSAEVGGSQFFPGATTQVEDVSLDFITPDSGITDMNVQSGSTVEPHEEEAEISDVMSKVTEWEPDEDAATVGCDEVPASPSSPMSPSGLGELRHTRDRLKLDLPTKNTAFVLDPPALGKRRAVETVKGEASLLDSGEETEDSGIESSNGALTSSKTLSLAENMKDTKV